MKIIIANWKMNPDNTEDARRIASRIEHGMLATDRSKVEVSICPPFVFMPVVKHAVHFVKIGAQDISFAETGPWTGEISAKHLLEFGTRYVIIGHSERRLLGEDSDMIREKIKISLEHQLEPIVCVGNAVKKSSTIGTIKRLLKNQIKVELHGIDLHKSRLTIAYEPAWAISRGLGTGQHADSRQTADVIAYIKEETRDAARVIYGGSINARNVHEFVAFRDIDGALVGSASLDPLEFLKIIKEFAK